MPDIQAKKGMPDIQNEECRTPTQIAGMPWNAGHPSTERIPDIHGLTGINDRPP